MVSSGILLYHIASMKGFVEVLSWRNPKANSPEGDSHELLLLVMVAVSVEIGAMPPWSNIS